MKAALWCRVDIARQLLEHGANVHAVDENGWTALAAALVWQHDELVRMILVRAAT